MNTCKRIKTQKYGQWNSCELLALMALESTVVYPVFFFAGFALSVHQFSSFGPAS